MEPRPVHTIAIFPKVQPDTVAAVLLLQDYGEKRFPGIAQAQVVFWTALPDGTTAAALEAAGTLPIDLGGGMFDHHSAAGRATKDSAATLVARTLGVDKDPALQKLLAYCKRDDLEGKGTLSADPLDRAFGLSGLMSTYNRVHRDDPGALLEMVLKLFRAHVREQRQRLEENPKEWKELKSAGKGREFTVKGRRGAWKVAVLESDNIALPGFLRAYFHVDLVVQRLATGHVNLISNQKRNVDLRPIVTRIRDAEAVRRNLDVPPEALGAPGRVEALPMWFYDVMANTIQNGGINPQHIEPTALSLEEIVAAVTDGLAEA